jgi:hypothetical protein
MSETQGNSKGASSFDVERCGTALHIDVSHRAIGQESKQAVVSCSCTGPMLRQWAAACSRDHWPYGRLVPSALACTDRHSGYRPVRPSPQATGLEEGEIVPNR